jgi:hypothetical protein
MMIGVSPTSGVTVAGAGVIVAQVVPQPPGQSPSQKKTSFASQSGGVHMMIGVSPLSGGKVTGTGVAGVGIWLPGRKRQAADRSRTKNRYRYLGRVNMLPPLTIAGDLHLLLSTTS